MTKTTKLVNRIMVKNMGVIDRVVRVIVAIIITTLFFVGLISGVFGYALLLFGGVLVFTSVIGHCLLYLPLRVNTCKKKTN